MISPKMVISEQTKFLYFFVDCVFHLSVILTFSLYLFVFLHTMFLTASLCLKPCKASLVAGQSQREIKVRTPAHLHTRVRAQRLKSQSSALSFPRETTCRVSTPDSDRQLHRPKTGQGFLGCSRVRFSWCQCDESRGWPSLCRRVLLYKVTPA